jgi:(p)ppGpp synthase/HD superfamily hydrolase
LDLGWFFDIKKNRKQFAIRIRFMQVSAMQLSGTIDPTASGLLAALVFAAQKHRHQQRKDGATHYINHPIAVAEVLARVGRVTDQAAALHDTLEDTPNHP